MRNRSREGKPLHPLLIRQMDNNHNTIMKAILIPFFLGFSAALAQQPDAIIIATLANGGNNTDVLLGGQQVNVNWTVGQAVIDPVANINDSHTIGFNQSFECIWYGMDTVSVPDLDPISQDTIGWHDTIVGPNPHAYSCAWAVTSVEEMTADSKDVQVRLFPNPTADVLNIEVRGLSAPGTTLTLTDLNGRLLVQGTITTDRGHLDMGRLTTGVYVLRLTTIDGRAISSHRIIRE